LGALIAFFGRTSSPSDPAGPPVLSVPPVRISPVEKETSSKRVIPVEPPGRATISPPGAYKLPSSLAPRPELSESRAKEAFPKLLQRNKEAVIRYGYGKSRFHTETLLHLREARLLVAAYPDLAERLATPIVRDLGGDRWERTYSSQILCMLAAQGSQTAPAKCRSLVDDADPFVETASLCGIGQADKDGSYKSLYLTKARQDCQAGFMILSNWPDSWTISEMNSMLGTGFEPMAKEVLAKIDLLAQPNWTESVAEILRGGKQLAGFDNPVDWALVVMKRRAPEKLRTILREELDKALDYGTKYFGQSTWNENCAREFATTADLSKVSGLHDYDDMLVSLSEVGGELREVEKARLRTFGYACEPKQRLAELLAEKE
jgi:hypothetical protein